MHTFQEFSIGSGSAGNYKMLRTKFFKLLLLSYLIMTILNLLPTSSNKHLSIIFNSTISNKLTNLKKHLFSNERPGGGAICHYMQISEAEIHAET